MRDPGPIPQSASQPAYGDGSSHSASARLLLASIRPEVNHVELVRLAAGIDWQDFLQLAASHDVVPLVFSRLSAVCPGAVPSNCSPRCTRRIARTPARASC